MIDFRYHLVSLVSVFIALAIGVVLGAGPLRGPLGDTLTTQVEALRDDKANLQQAVTNRDNEIATQNTALQELGARSVSGTLTGRRVLQVVLPGADPADLVGFADLLKDSGAQVTGTVTINPAWSDPSASSARKTVLGTLAPVSAAAGVTATDDDQLALAKLLAAATANPTPQAPASANASVILRELTSAKLMSSTGDLPPADLVVVFAAGATSGAAGDDEKWQSAETASGADLVRGLRSGSAGVVVSGPASVDKGLIAELRGESAIATTVDGINSTAAVGVVLGLLQATGGGVGHFGSGPGATTSLPPLPAVAAPAPAPSAATPTGTSTP